MPNPMGLLTQTLFPLPGSGFKKSTKRNSRLNPLWVLADLYASIKHPLEPIEVVINAQIC